MVAELVGEGEIEEKCPHCIVFQLENARLKEALSEMEQRANHDPLTELPNRRYFIESLEKRIRRCQRYGDNTALLFLDVDDLKSINDTHGHAAGDALLIHLAKILKDNIRACDMVARIGGDEFALLLDNLDADQVEHKILSLIDRIKTANLVHDDRVLKFGAAIGYSFVGPADTVSALMSRADEAMYQSKNDNV
ncbi:GGDEF domain-containing protein [Parasphingorhabdus cellanae]|uniref:diguanylate cyclase n=1 Tax=Parasphingorhabdus cellanae TaxID=2806553 RepID=A0ABX7SZ50_9SPHN|nr:GGDEF domain-containing protein [Parasphingorhabdus cellanae]QTD54535.1 GGDEF domain-containing protein [Parasphingorhabdus cellanae]